MSAEEASHVIVSNSSEADADADADADVRAFSDVVRSLPSDAVRDLRSRGVCNRCIIRSFGVAEPVSPRPLLLQSIFSWLVGVPEDSNGSLVNGGPEEKKDLSSQPAYEDPEYRPAVCSICLGILQFCCMDNNTSMVKNNASNELAASIAQRVKQEAHEIDRFSLEVSIPQCIMEKESRFLSLVSRNNNEPPERSHSERISLKDALKKLLATPLEMLLGVKYGQGPFHIRLTYSEPSEIVESPIDGGHDSKRRKTGVNNGSDTAVSSVFSNTGCDTTGEVPAVSETPFNGFLHDQSSACSNLSQKKVQKPCCLSIHCYRDPIYFGGRYLKYARNVSQTCWMIDEERMGEASVEEIISGHILSACRGDKYKFHAAGREDIDVRMLGSGRPFLVEIQNARHVPSDGMVKEIEGKINRPRNKLVGVKNLKLVGSQGWALLREGEAEKQKEYAALVWISRPLEDNDLLSVSSARDMQIMQRTPIRVLHRRSPLEREKIIHWMKIEKIAGSSQYFILHLCTQAGTYIKEFVHGDLGRTYPSIGSMLGCRAEILQLDVTDVKMDCFWPDKDIEGHGRGIGQSSNSTSFAGACPST